MNLEEKSAALRQRLQALGPVVVALSGGVDSVFLLWEAVQALGQDQVLAVTATTPICFDHDQERARAVAGQLGVRFEVVATKQLEDAHFVQNPPNRCYFCKREIFSRLRQVADREGISWVIEGSNADDRSEFRPGAQAAGELNILSPMEAVELDKSEIRELSRRANLPTWDVLSETCLATRIPHGNPVTLEKLDQIKQAEDLLHRLGFPIVRVRHHGTVARIEVPPESLADAVQPKLAARIAAELKALGFRYVALDLEGYRRGSLEATP